jgi:hypothetical protein
MQRACNHRLPCVYGEHQVGWHFATWWICDILSMQSLPGPGIIVVQAVDVKNDLPRACKHSLSHDPSGVLRSNCNSTALHTGTATQTLSHLVDGSEGCAAYDVQGSNDLGERHAAMYESLGGYSLCTLQGFDEGWVTTCI